MAAGFGGGLRFLSPTAELQFDADNGSSILRPVTIGIVEPTAANRNLPSVLGMDFLQHFRLTISVRDAQVELESRL